MDGYLKPSTIQLIGIGIFIAAAVFWALTEKESVTIMSFATSLIGIGAYSKTVEKLGSVLERHVETRAIKNGNNGS